VASRDARGQLVCSNRPFYFAVAGVVSQHEAMQPYQAIRPRGRIRLVAGVVSQHKGMLRDREEFIAISHEVAEVVAPLCPAPMA
jgi:hypothetical protein